MKKILVVGSSGAGKSMLSRRLGEITALPVIHLDFHHWRPGWTEPEKEVWEAQVTELLKTEEWIMDGNFGGTMERRLESCDTAVFLDLAARVCLAGHQTGSHLSWGYASEPRPWMSGKVRSAVPKVGMGLSKQEPAEGPRAHR